MVDGVLASRTKDELYRMALEHLLLLAPINTVADLRLDDQLAARRYWQPVEVGPHAVERHVPGALGPPQPQPAARHAPGAPRRRARHGGPRGAPSDEPDEHRRGAGRRRARPDDDPFAGLKVWDMSWVGVGPLTARYLADYGATVVRLDSSRRADVLRAGPPFAGGQPGLNRSHFYADFNACKLGVGIDLGPTRRAGRWRSGWRPGPTSCSRASRPRRCRLRARLRARLASGTRRW